MSRKTRLCPDLSKRKEDYYCKNRVHDLTRWVGSSNPNTYNYEKTVTKGVGRKELFYGETTLGKVGERRSLGREGEG